VSELNLSIIESLTKLLLRLDLSIYYIHILSLRLSKEEKGSLINLFFNICVFLYTSKSSNDLFLI